ncbi:MAG: glycosyltransferase family 4 protein, partial [Planctomycetales bacterium]
MHIGVELRQIQLGGSGGVTHLLRGLLAAACDAHPEHDFLMFCTEHNERLFADFPSNTRCVTLSERDYFPHMDRLCDSENIQVLFRSFPLNQLVRFPFSKQIVMIPDLQHETFPEFFDPAVLEARREGFNEALAKAGAVATISEYARETIRRHPSTACSKIILTPPALNIDHQQEGETERAPRHEKCPSQEFFFYPANLWPHKNHRRVLRAFELFLDETGADVAFAFTGHPDGWEELRAEFSHLPIVHLGYVEPELMHSLFQHAIALAFFSLYEGFGMPLLEAFRHGAPVLCGNVTSLPEVASDAALTCDPTDVTAMANLMEKAWRSPEARAQLVRAGKQRWKAYSWEKSADVFVAACEELAGVASQQPSSRFQLVL